MKSHLHGLDVLGVPPLSDCLKAGEAFRRGQALGYTPPTGNPIVTPSAIKDEMDNVMREAKTLDADIAAYQGADAGLPAFRAAWGAFLAEYKKFYDDNASGVSGWLSRLWGSMMDRTVAYGNKVNDWRVRFSKFPGANPTEPAVTAVQNRQDDSSVPWKPILIGGVVVAGVGATGYVLAKLGVLASIFGGGRK